MSDKEAALFEKRLGKLVPTNEAADDALRAISNGKIVEVTIKQPRNPRRLRLYWALCNLVCENSDRFESREQVSDHLKIALGHCDTFVTGKGQVGYVPKSISFAKLSEADFVQFFDRAVNAVCKHFLQGSHPKEVHDVLFEMIGGRDAA